MFEKYSLYNPTPTASATKLIEAAFELECRQFKPIIETTVLATANTHEELPAKQFATEKVEASAVSSNSALLATSSLDHETIESLIIAAHIAILEYTRRQALSLDHRKAWTLHIRVLKAYLTLQEQTDSLSVLQARQIVSVVRGMEGADKL